VDVQPDGVTAEEGGGLVVGEFDSVIADDEEGLGRGGEEALGIEAGQRRSGFLLDQLSSASTVGPVLGGPIPMWRPSRARMPDGGSER